MRCRSPRPGTGIRPFVALIVLIAWLGTLLVAGPVTMSRAEAATSQPTVIAPASPSADSTPTFTYTLPPDTTDTTVTVTPSDTSTTTIEVRHRGLCAVTFSTDPAPAPASYGTCGTRPDATTSPLPYTPTLALSGSYVLHVLDEETTTTTTNVEDSTGTVTPGTPSTGTQTSTPGTSPSYTYDGGVGMGFDSQPASPSTSATPSWTFHTGDATSVSCSIAPPVAGLPSACTSPVDLTLPGDGTYTLSIVGTDALGNSETITSTYELTTPNAPGVAVSSPGNGTNVVWTITPRSGATGMTATLTAPDTTTSTQTLAGNATSLTTTLPSATEGPWVLSVTATFSTGVSAAGTATYALDTTNPVLTVGTANATDPTRPAWAVSVVDAAATTPQCAVTGTTATGVAYDSGLAPCGSTYTSAALAEGAYTLTVTATDAAGNIATPVSRPYTYDAAPGVATVAGPASPGNSTTPGWTVVTQTTAGTSVSCVVTNGTGFSRTALCNPGTTTFSTDLTDGAGRYDEGNYTLTVLVSDGGGTSAPVTATYVLDTIAPGVTITAAADNSTTATAGWTVAVTGGGGTPVCTLENSANTALGAGTGCAQFTTFTLPAQDTYTFTATTTDPAGNSTSASDTWIYRAAPTAAVTTPQPTGNSTSVGFHVTATNGTTLVCTLTAPGGATQNYGCVNGSTPVATVGPAQGTWRFDVVATDPQTGYTGAASATYLYDNVAPDAFTVDGTNGDQKTRAVSWTWTAPEAGLTQSCQLLLAGATYGTATACSDAYTTPLPTDGAWQLRVTLTDAAGNSTSDTGPEDRVDTVAPIAPGVTTGKTLSNDVAPVWTITGEATSAFTCSWTATVADPLPTTGACANGYAPTLPSANGTYTLHVVQTDPALNVSPEKTFAYTLDVIAPTVTFTVQPATPNKDTTPTWTTAVSESTVKIECRLTRTGDSFVVHDWQTAGCGRTVTETLPADGTYVLQVRDTDAAGNVTLIGTSSAPYALDTTGPGTPTVDGPFGWGAENDVTWTITAPSGEVPAGYRCRLVQDGIPGNWSACDTMTYSTTLNAQATYRLDVESLDALDNASNPTTSSADYMYDPYPPAAATFIGSAGTGNVTSRTWTWTPGEPNLTATCQLYTVDGTRTAVGTSVACTSPKTVSLASPTTGTTYVLEVTLTDRAGNFTRADGPAYLLDTVAPVAPQVAGPSGTNRTRAATYTFVASEPGTTARCDLMQRPLNSTTWTSVQNNTACPATWNVTLPNVDGDYAVRVVTTDAAGNPSLYGESQTYTLDVTGPVAPVFATGPTGTDNVPAVIWTWSFENLSTATCTLTHAGAPVGSAVACNSGSFSTTLAAGDGDYVLTVQLTDQYGNSGGTTASVTYALDLTPPGAPQVTGPSTTSNRTTADYAIVGPIETGATEECRLERDAALVSDWASCTLPTSRVLSGDGAYVFLVRLTDQYGNLGPAGSSPSYLLDTLPPAVPVVTPPTSPSRDVAPIFTIAMDAGTTASCTLARGSSVVAVAPSCSGSFTGALAGLADGDYVLTVASKDAAGNIATGTSAAYSFDTTAPTVPVVTGPPGPSQNKNPVFSWTAEAGSRAECSVQEKAGSPSGWTACAAPYAPTLPSDGTWVLSVRLIDVAGNISAGGSSGGYLLDTTPPTAPVVTAPASPGRNLGPTWSADTEPGSTTECRFTGPGQTPAGFTACTLPLLTPVSTDGSYVLEVRTTDVAGNISPAGSGTYVLDTTAPPAPVLSQPTGPGRNRTPAIAYTAEAGTTGSCRLTRGSTVLSETGPCSSPVQLNLTDLPDGAYTLTVRAVDAAGNTGPAATATYVLDTTAPAVPVMSLIAGSPSSDRAPQFGFSAETSAVLACRVTTPGGQVKELSCTSPVTLDLSASAEGDYTFAVTARDAAGNTSAAATADYTLSNSAPAAPRVTGPVTPGSSRTPTWRIAAGSPVQCRIVRGTTTFVDWFACGSLYTADLYNQPDGIYLLEARVVGTTAQTTSRYRLDTAGPAAAVITAPPSPSTVRKPTWAIASAEVGATAECRVTVFGGALQDWTPCAVTAAGALFGYDLTGLGDGVYTLSVRLTDNAGNAGAVATSNYELDTSAPAAVGVIGPASPGNNPRPTWTLSSTTGAKLECRVTSGQKVIKEFAPCSGSFTVDLTGFPDGPYTLTVHALSAAGTPGPETTSTYDLDTTKSGAPTMLTTSEARISRNRQPIWQFDLPAGSTAVCTVLFGGIVYREGPCISPYTMDLTNGKDGSYVLRVVAFDKAGNPSDPATAGYTLRTAPAPAPEFTLEPGSPSSTVDPRWAFSTAYDVTTECRVEYEGVLQDAAWFGCPKGHTMLLTGQPDGKYTLQVRAVDVAQNPSTPIESSYEFDRTAPALAVILETPVSPGVDLSPTWSISAPAAPVTSTAPALLRAAALTTTAGPTECRFTKSAQFAGSGSWTPCTGTYTGATSGEGRYLFELRPTGTTSTTATRSLYQLDLTDPAPLRFTDTPPAVGNKDTASWSWDEDPQVRVQCRFFRGTPSGAFSPCASPYTVDVSRLGQATYSLEAQVVDRAGNVSDSTVSSYRYDTTPPPAPAFTSRPASRGTSGTATWTFAVPAGATAVCVVTHEGNVVENPCNAGSWSVRMSTLGTWTLSVRFVDEAGNVGAPTSGSYTLTSVAFVRDRVDGKAPGAGPIRPRGDTGGPDEPGVATPANAPFIGPSLGRGPASVIPRVTEAIKKAGRSAAGAFPRTPAGIAEDIRVPDAIKNVIGTTITQPQLPLALFVIVVLFLLVQNRIDRRDPKLAAAPVAAEPELEFGPRVRFVATGGVTA